jgi:hypothetical protein
MDAFEQVTAWYERMLPELRVSTIDSPDPVFNLALCRNLAVASLEDPDEVIVLGDADTLPEPDALREAIVAARTSNLVHLPYTAYHWLGAAGSAQFAAGVPPEDCDFVLIAGACSGVYVTTRRAWDRHGGQDPRFRGWGYEDAAWNLAHTTMLGAAPQRHAGRVYALHHHAEIRAGAQYEANAALMERYRSASGDASAMASLISVR